MIDVVQQINAVSRRVGARVLEAGEARTVTVSQTYDAPLEDVWDACTNAERIPRWFLPVTGELRPGGHYRLEGNASGTIERCDPPNGFAATWEYGGEISWIELRLSTTAEGATRFALEHTGPVDDTRWAQFGPGAVGVGWDGALLGLSLYLKGGSIDDPEAWQVSAEGRDFYTRSSTAWGAANLASGADPEAAARAVANSTRFYAPDPDAAS